MFDGGFDIRPFLKHPQQSRQERAWQLSRLVRVDDVIPRLYRHHMRAIDPLGLHPVRPAEMKFSDMVNEILDIEFSESQ
jgi:hypothetical protein